MGLALASRLRRGADALLEALRGASPRAGDLAELGFAGCECCFVRRCALLACDALVAVGALYT